MAYNEDELLAQARKVAREKKCHFHSDVYANMVCSKSAYYTYYKLHEDDEINDILEQNRVELKIKLRAKWAQSENAALQMGLMKLIGTSDERKKLSTNYMDITSDGESVVPNKIQVEFKDFTDDEDSSE